MTRSKKRGEPKLRVVVFCASSPNGPRKEEYLEIASRFGEMLALEGFAVGNGGNMGMMTAISVAAHSAGAHVTCICLNKKKYPMEHKSHSQLEHWEELTPRQKRLLEIGDAYVALPGGIGTLYEISQVIAMKSIDEISPTKPMICVGEAWRKLEDLLRFMVEQGLCYKNPLEHATFVDTEDQALALLKEYRSER